MLPSVAFTLGPTLIGYTIATFLFGFTTIQVRRFKPFKCYYCLFTVIQPLDLYLFSKFPTGPHPE